MNEQTNVQIKKINKQSKEYLNRLQEINSRT